MLIIFSYYVFMTGDRSVSSHMTPSDVYFHSRWQTTDLQQ